MTVNKKLVSVTGFKKQCCDSLLENLKGRLSTMLVIAWDHEGNLITDGMSDMTVAEMVYAIEMLKLEILNGNLEGMD